MMPAAVLALEGVSVAFDGLTVLDDLDFAMAPGELRFLIGPNGAGKTTLLDVITGRTRPAKGRATFDGDVDLAHRQEHEIARLGIGRKFQTPSVFGSLTVFENLAVAIGRRDRWPAFFRALAPTQRTRIEEVLARVGLADQPDRPASLLSHGETQWLEIGMLLVQDPKLLLLDEPVAGMTRPERDKTGALLSAISGSHSILVVEHDMAFVREFARTVTVLHLGRVLSEGPIETVQNDPRVIDVYLGHRSQKAS
jgi:urea transport system ATP-binding protein